MLVLLFLCSCSNQESNIPEEITDYLDKYMTAFKDGPASAVQYCYFKEEFEKNAYLGSTGTLIDYKIEKSEKINDDLYAFTNLVETSRTKGHYERVYNFVGVIDRNMYFILNVANIPDEISTNLDKDRYSYK